MKQKLIADREKEQELIKHQKELQKKEEKIKKVLVRNIN